LCDDTRSAISVIFEIQGEHNATSSAINAVIGSELGLENTLDAVVVLPCFGQSDPPGMIADGHLTVRGLATKGLERCNRVVVPALTHGTTVAVTVDTDSLERRPVGGMDPAAGLFEVKTHAAIAAENVTSDPVDWDLAMAAGRRALSHELLGAQKQMLRLARDHAVGRVQFGRPISAFQAVRHRLADSLVAVQSADAALGAAWEEPCVFTAAVAKAIAGRSSKTVARHCQQVLAVIGFTAAHPFNGHLRRTLVLDSLLGSSRSISRGLGEELLRTLTLPAAIPL